MSVLKVTLFDFAKLLAPREPVNIPRKVVSPGSPHGEWDLSVQATGI